MPNEKKNAAAEPQTLKEKLLCMQRELKTFAITEDSEKKDSRGKSEYKYTPGWKIIERMRELMDRFSLMLRPSYKLISSELVDYPVYKMIEGKPMSFTKKEIHVVIEASFTWVDVATGEEDGPHVIVASGANGTDKSCASALSLAKRYFLKEFFNFTTRDPNDEPDAHDSDTLPGIPRSQQPMNAPAAQAAAAQAYAPVAAASAMQAPPATAPSVQVPGQRNPYPTPPSYGQAAQPQGAGFDTSNTVIQQAVMKLANFDKGTPTHQQVLNECIGMLSGAGFNCFAPNFMNNLTETAQAMREGRAPQLV